MIGLEYFLLLISGTRFSLCDFNSFLFTKFCEIDLILFVCFYFIYVFIFLVTIHFNISVVPPAHMKIPELNHHFCVLHLSRFIYNYQLGNIFLLFAYKLSSNESTKGPIHMTYNTALLLLQYQYANTSSPKYKDTGKGTLKLQLIKQRSDFSFALFSGGLFNVSGVIY